MSVQPAFQGEVQFRRWSDSSTQGVQVTFALPDSEALEPLKHKAGKRFMAVLVEIGDDEQPVQPSGWADLGPKCREANDLTKVAAFTEYVMTVSSFENKQTAAEKYIKAACGIESRKELDTSEAAYERFIRVVRGPYLAWLRTRAKQVSRGTPPAP